eukprot:5748978-Prymnesium_polylepis.1
MEAVATAEAAVVAMAAAATAAAGGGAAASKPKEMRPLMTRALDEALSGRPAALYVGEDVEHGGYYRVSEGLVG